MDEYSNFLISTTHTLQGYEVSKYLGAVTAHVVAGTNLFSDLLASVSDIFGGRSETYQKQLDSLKNEVIEILVEKAKNLGANGVLGLKLDFDEISGKAKQMFMVSASGTAVKVKRNDSTGEIESSRESLIGEKVEMEVEKLELLALLMQDDYSIDSEDWQLILENNIPEVFDYLIKRFHKIEADTSDKALFMESDFYRNFIKYLGRINRKHISDKIYMLFFHNSTLLQEVGFNCILNRGLFSYKQILRMLSEERLSVRNSALKILYNVYKPTYSTNDIDELKNIIMKVNSSFPEIVKSFTKKKLLTSETSEYWECVCEVSNPITNDYCKACRRDRRGLQKKDITPEEVTEHLSAKIQVLKTQLAH